jgi:hypothetical protein
MSDADLQASIRNVTLAELAGAVAAVDEVARESFRCGPIPREGRREGCRMCQTLKRAARAEGAERGYEMEWLEERVLVPGDPYGVLWAWHESHEMIIARAWTRTFVQANPSVEEIRRYGNATTLCGWGVPDFQRACADLSREMSAAGLGVPAAELWKLSGP